MRHTVTVVHEVEAPSWDMAVEAILAEPVQHMASCKVKLAGSSVVHVTVSVLKHLVATKGEEK